MSGEDISDTFGMAAKGFRGVRAGSENKIDQLPYSMWLDPKTTSLIRIGIAAAQGPDTGMPLHVALARDAGATKDEIISAIMLGLPPEGQRPVPVSSSPLELCDPHT